MLNLEERKQRKRKLSDHNAAGGTEKVQKEEIYRKKNELLNQEDKDEDATAEMEVQPEEIQEEELNTSNSFSMKKFREKLREGEFITGKHHITSKQCFH